MWYPWVYYTTIYAYTQYTKWEFFKKIKPLLAFSDLGCQTSGFSLFIYLLYLALGDGIRNIREHYAEVGIIVAALLQSIGSNILAFQICAPVFWFAIGACLCGKKESV